MDELQIVVNLSFMIRGSTCMGKRDHNRYCQIDISVSKFFLQETKQAIDGVASVNHITPKQLEYVFKASLVSSMNC